MPSAHQIYFTSTRLHPGGNPNSKGNLASTTVFSAPLYVDDLVEESELVERQTGAPLGARSRLAARVAATPIALSPNGCKGKKSRIARRGNPRCARRTLDEATPFFP